MGGRTKPSQAPLVNQSSITSAIMAGVPASRPRGLRTAAAKLMPCALAIWLMRSREPAMPWLPAAASASSAVSIVLRSTPSRVEDEASTSSGSIRLSRKSAFSRAIDSVSPMTTDRVGRTATSVGQRPAAVSLRCMSARNSMPSGLVAVVQKIMSAQRAAHSRPRGEEPACRMSGRPCGLRGMDIGPRVRTKGPTWSA